MTVGSQVKGCYFSIKSAKATLQQLISKSQTKESKQAFEEATQLLTEIQEDLGKQVTYLSIEEPQYK
ncbi:DUF1657 domain-containing protein [Virgibacillus sp. W0430]|uniref:DUF1657 domain-containing protein n=1 Tax=Virgibacillus sp. W0430 TaxID=3391580 RepID=UPI003F47E8E1